METLHTLRVLFQDLGIFSAGAENTLTQKCLDCIANMGPIHFWENGREVVGLVPAPDRPALDEFAKNVFALAKSAFEAQFPGHEHVNAYAAFDLEASNLSWADRKELVLALGTHEGVDGTLLWPLSLKFDTLLACSIIENRAHSLTRPSFVACLPQFSHPAPHCGLRRQLAGSDREDEPKLGMFVRAMFYCKNPDRAASRSQCGSVANLGKSRAAWLRTLTELTPPQREGRALAVQVTEKMLSLQSGTQSVERWLGESAFTEGKFRAQHLAEWNLERSIKLNLQSLEGARVPKGFSPDELFQHGTLKPTKFGADCQAAYKEFFGERHMPSRLASGKDLVEKPRLGNIRKESTKRSLTGELKKHSASVKTVVQEAGPSSSSSWQPLVSEMRDVLDARASASPEERAAAAECIVEMKRSRGLGDRSFEDAIEANEQLSKKKRAVAVMTPPGKCVPYIDSNGGVYSLKVPAAEPTSLPAPALNEIIKIWAAPDAKVPRWRRYEAVQTFDEADVVLVRDAQRDILSPTALQARLWGKRLACVKWANSKMKEGFCTAFAAGLSRHLHLFLHPSFLERHSEHANILLEASARFKERGGRACLNVQAGLLPDKPAHPRLSFQVMSQVQPDEASKAHMLDLQQCLNKLTTVMR